MEDAERAERERRAKLSAAHRALEDEQSTALAATCDKTAPAVQPTCAPSCYAPEPADPRAGKKLQRAEIVHLACKHADDDPVLLADELGGGKLAARAVRGRFPKPHKHGSWELDVETAVSTALHPEVSRGDVVRVTGAWQTIAHPVTKEALRCVAVSHYVTTMRRAFDACGARGGIACEATRNDAVHGINVVHYRLAEARQLHAAGKDTACQQAALEAIAVSRGLPRWRQYVSLNTNAWKSFARYRTRFDGVVDEDTLFTTAAGLGTQAEAVYAECGGGNPKTIAAQEQSFHTCW